MRIRTVAAAILAAAIGLSACGKYGAPVRTVQQKAGAPGETRQEPTRPQEPTLDETATQPSEFDF